MFEELQILIQQSGALSEVEKSTYLEMIKHLPETQVQNLYQILKKEQDAKDEKRTATSEINQKYIQKLAQTFKKEEKKAKAKEEKQEKKDSEKLLDQLNDA